MERVRERPGVDATFRAAMRTIIRRYGQLEMAMATECTAYRDDKGSLHPTPERATLADLAHVLGRVGEEGGMTAGVAKLIFEKRGEIERVFAEHDQISPVPVEPHVEGGEVVPIVDAR